MITEFRYTFTRYRWSILGWGLGLASLGLIIVGFYDTFMEEQEQFLDMVDSYPPELLAFFGGDASQLASSEGYLGMYGFSLLPVIIGIFAVMAGSGLIASDEEGGQLDLILAHPLSRTGFFIGRVTALIVTILLIDLFGWAGFSMFLGGSQLELKWFEMALPFIPLIAQALIYAMLAMLLSMLLPARRLATMGAGLILVTSYFLTSMSELNEGLGRVAQFLPYDYFQGSDALNGINMGWLLGLLGVALLLGLLAWWRFQKRDVRVAGEGRWLVIRKGVS